MTQKSAVKNQRSIPFQIEQRFFPVHNENFCHFSVGCCHYFLCVGDCIWSGRGGYECHTVEYALSKSNSIHSDGCVGAGALFRFDMANSKQYFLINDFSIKNSSVLYCVCSARLPSVCFVYRNYQEQYTGKLNFLFVCVSLFPFFCVLDHENSRL